MNGLTGARGHRRSSIATRPIAGASIRAAPGRVPRLLEIDPFTRVDAGRSRRSAAAAKAKAKAIRYARSRWTALRRYLDDGALKISNNAVERAIRPPRPEELSVRRLRCRGERGAAVYTLVESAKLNSQQRCYGNDLPAVFVIITDRCCGS
jgi:hypothetical protein